MQKTAPSYERITISVPLSVSEHIETMKNELHLSKSELMKIAFEKFHSDYETQKLSKIAEDMAQEYRANNELTTFNDLDGDDFK